MILELKKWQLWFGQDNLKDYRNIDELEKSSMKNFNVQVPCNFEYELQKNGLLGDLYYGDNVFKAQNYEYYHQWYTTKFDCDFENPEIVFKGIDTVSEIFLNGKLLKKTDNMFLEYVIPLTDIKKKGNEIVVHIYPVMDVAKNYEIGAGSFSHIYNSSSLHIRKSPSVYGWDIFPRLLGGGIWKDVVIIKGKKSFFKETYLYTCNILNPSTRPTLILFYKLSGKRLFLL